MPLLVKVDDQYWLDYAKTITDSATTSRDQAASRLTSALGWLWTIYTGAATVGVALGKTDFPLYIALLIAAPVPLILVGYWLSMWASSPVLLRFDPQVPADMRAVYARIVQTKDRRLVLALSVSLLASVTAASSIVVASVSTPTPSTTLRAKYQLESGDTAVIEIAGVFAGQNSVVIRVLGFADSKMSGESGRYLVTLPLSQDGRLQRSVSPGFKASFYLVVAEWSAAGEMRGATCLVEGVDKATKT
jgi:hypothetical protein